MDFMDENSALLILQPACRLQDLDIQAVVEEVLRRNLRGLEYGCFPRDKLSRRLKLQIRHRLRRLEQNFVVLKIRIFIGSAMDEYNKDMAATRRTLPDAGKDVGQASAWYKSDSLFAVGTVYVSRSD